MTYVERERVPSVRVEEHVVVGEPLPERVELRSIPRYEKYRYAVVNENRVIVDPETRKIVKIIEKQAAPRHFQMPGGRLRPPSGR